MLIKESLFQKELDKYIPEYKKEYKATIATTAIDKQGERFDIESLKRAARDAINKTIPVRQNFQGLPIGRVLDVKVEDNMLRCRIELADTDAVKELLSTNIRKALSASIGLSPALGGEVTACHQEGDVRVIDDFKLREISLIEKEQLIDGRCKLESV